MTKYLLPLLLLLNLPAISQTITPKNTQTPSSTVCIPLESARIVTQSLQKYELLKPAYNKLQKANNSLLESNTYYKQSLASKDSALVYSQQSVGNLTTLYGDSKTKATLWEKKAHRNGLRFWLLAIATTIIAGVAISH